MRLDDLRPTENIDDRRGQGGFSYGSGGGGLAIGGGGLVTVVIVIAALLFGFDPTQILMDPSLQQPPQAQQADPYGAPAGPLPNEEAFSLSARVVGSTEQEWGEIFAERGLRYQPAVFTPYTRGTQTACGVGQAAMGPFYCPADRRVYIDLEFFRELDQRFGAPGDFAQAYVIAHEVGHHVQNLLGVMDRGGRRSNQESVATELQADCFAGVWAARANRRHRILEPGDVEEGLRAASAVGDDALQAASGRGVAPDSFTHGSSADRMRWFQRGLQTGDPEACDTFGRGGVFGR